MQTNIVEQNREIVAEMYEIFNSIKESSGRNDKIKIIKNNSSNDYFKHFLTFLYDDMITTGLSKRKISKKIELKGATTIRGFSSPMSIMDYLEKWNTGTDKIILEVQSYLRDLDEPHQTFMSEVLTKRYKCGITANSVNMAIPNHIKQFKPMLAHSYEKYEGKITGGFTITTKLDGHRTLAEVTRDGVIFRTRKGHVIEGLTELEDELSKIFKQITCSNSELSKGYMLDGEITVANESTPKEDVFQETSKIIRSKGEKVGLAFYVFDIVPLDEFWAGESVSDYAHRRRMLESMIVVSEINLGGQVENIRLVQSLYTGRDKSQVHKWLKKATDNGEEGIMVNLLDKPYQGKRTSAILKVKKFFDADLEVLGVFEGEGRLEGMLGGIYVDYKGSKVGVGTGFSDAERDYYWKNQDEIVGRVVEVSYFEESKNQKDDNLSLRFPVFEGLKFKHVRLDKDLSDVNYD